MSIPLPNWSDFAREPSTSQRPELWDALAGLWCPALGQSGERLFDTSAYKNHGALVNMNLAIAWQPSPEGWRLDFDGADDYASLGDPPQLRFSGAHTIVWYGYASTSGADSSGLLSKCGGNGYRASGIQLAGNAIYLWWAANATTIDYYSAGIVRRYPLPDVFAGTLEPGVRVAIYQNGRLLAEKTSGVCSTFFNDNGLPWCLMTRGDAGSKTAGGLLCGMLFNCALSAAEIAALSADPLGMLRPLFSRKIGCLGAIGGPYCIDARQIYQSGMTAGDLFFTGQTAGQTNG